MRGLYRHAPRLADGLIGGRGVYAQHSIGVVLHMAGPQAAKAGVIQTKYLRHAAQKHLFGRVKLAVSDGDVKQAFHQVDHHIAVRRFEHGADFTGIGVKARHILTGEIKDLCSTCLFAFGNGEDTAKGGHFVARYQSVSLGHFGTQGDNGDGEAY